nr:YgiQ family radical SAM protein [Methanohalophilus levihalophilus]
MSLKEASARGWDKLDIIIVTGDAYIDHPSFGAAIIGRVLEDKGLRVGIIAQPTWENTEDFRKLGEPELFFAVTAGNVDSMVSNYTPSLKPRKKDMYSPGGKPGRRPDRTTIVYSNRIHEAYPGVPIVIGGIEASLRRFSHYDFQSDKVRQSLLADAPADILIFGMGELQTTELAERMREGGDIHQIRDVPGTMWKIPPKQWRDIPHENIVALPSYKEVVDEDNAFAKAFATIHREQDPIRGSALAQPHPKTVVVQNPPARSLTQEELDHVYELPFTRKPHPSYKEPIPAMETVRFSLTTHRGCFGSCSFCAITYHQGRMISSRSIGSILREAEILTKMKEFKGIITGVGGPTANMYGMKCKKWDKQGACSAKNCLYPDICPSLDTDHSATMKLLTQLRKMPDVRKVFVGYGIRHDLALESPEYMELLCRHHISGRLTVAPESYSPETTQLMRKPAKEVFEEFNELFTKTNKKLNKKQYLLTYLMSGHPGCDFSDMADTAEYIRDTGLYTEQVQDFTPTPMTASTCMYHTGIDPFTGKKVKVVKGRRDKKIMRSMLHYREPRNRNLVYEGLEKAGRLDLVGNSRDCLIQKKKPQSKRK